MTSTTSKILTVAVAIAILISVIVLVYVNLPPSKKHDVKESPPLIKTSLLTVSFNGVQNNYTLDDLESLESFTGTGGYIKTKVLPTVSTSGPFKFTGVTIAVLLNHISDLPDKYSIIVTSSDNYTKHYNLSQIHGDVPVYNNAGDLTGSHRVTMLLAYMENGTYINDTEVGPLRIGYVEDGAFTPSELWTKMVTSIKVISE